MYGVNRSRLLCGIAALGLAAISALPATAGGYKPFYNFAGADGQKPTGELVADSQGRLYGTTMTGGAHDGGVVFRLTRSGQKWTQEVLFSFPAGQNPRGGVTIGASGELYGVSTLGGTFGNGSVWRLDLNGSTWSQTTLHSFDTVAGDGFWPTAGLVIGKDGTLYGTTTGQQPQDGSVPGPNEIYGTVFRVSPTGDGFAVLHVFGATNDGQTPGHGRLIVDRKGVLTGTTALGGKSSEGTVWQLSPPKKGQTAWSEAVLRSFAGTGSDAIGPATGVVVGLDGKFYGCAAGGIGNGAVYSVDPAGSEQVLYSFGSQPGDAAALSSCAVAIDRTGTITGTAIAGGANANKGAAFRLVPDGSGGWTETVLHSFGAGGDGANPDSAPLKIGKIVYGMAVQGGTHGDGMVFSLKP
jgi:uncharacterized repeat protein (TIGR03803 family)